MIAPMRNRRSGIGVIALDGFVYAIGECLIDGPSFIQICDE